MTPSNPGRSSRWFVLALTILAPFAHSASAAESEPNNNRAQANPLIMDGAGHALSDGRINPRPDLDVFSISTPAFPGQTTLVITMTPTASDHGLDARLQLQDADGNVLVDRDDGFDNKAESISLTSATGGTSYFIVCRSADLFDSGSGDYTLQVDLTLPDDVIPGAVRLGPVGQTITRSGDIASPMDVDLFSFTTEAGQWLSFDLDRTSAGFDSEIRLFDSDGTPLGTNNDASGPGESGGLDSYLEYVFAHGGTYYLGVSGHANTNYDAATGTGQTLGSMGSYTLVVSPGLAGSIRRPGDTTEYPVDILRYGSAAQAINPGRRTWIVIHGWNSSRTNNNISQLAASLLEDRPEDQVLTLDWSSAADTGLLPFDAESSIVPVAEWAAAALVARGFSGRDLNLVGHSFGSYVADEIAQRIPGGVNTMVTLDPAADVLGGFDPVSGDEVDFARDSVFSWSFHASSFGDEYTPVTADESFLVESGHDSLSAHRDVVFLFANLLLNPIDAVGRYFLLTRLLDADPGPWVPDQYVSDFTDDDPVRGYDAILFTGSGGTNAQSIRFVTNAPILQITSHADRADVLTNPIALAGVATDAGRGGNGMASVLVNGIRADGDTAPGSGVANWSRLLRLVYGANVITVVGRDGGAQHASVTNVITLNYIALPDLAMSFANDSVTVSWPVSYATFALERSDDVGSPDGWSPVPEVPNVTGQRFAIVLPASESRRFFRLRNAPSEGRVIRVPD